MNDNFDSLAALRQEFNERLEAFREEAKEREPSFLRALKTFIADSAACYKGERDLPKAAAIGLF